MSETATSRDGTRIAYERAGSGSPLILIDAAGHFRANSPFGDLSALLAKDFTVVRYDRRGRGDSTDTPPYAPAREVEDLEALIDAVGGPAALYGFSSGCLVALHASATGLPLSRLVLVEPPISADTEAAADTHAGGDAGVDAHARTAAHARAGAGAGAGADTRSAQEEFIAHLAARTGADAVEFFLASIGVPDDLLAGMRGTAHWDAMVSVAPTLVYDSMLSAATTADLLRRVRTPTLVVDSTGSSDDLAGMAAAAAALLPNATARSLPGGWHGVPAETLAPVVSAFLMESVGSFG